MATVNLSPLNHKEEPIRKRTRATAEQLAVLEDMFAMNVSPNSKVRKQLADQLKMTDRSIQIWFQNRRAKVKHMQKRAQLQMHQANMRAQLYHYQQQHYYLQQQYAPHQRAHSLDSYNYYQSTSNATTPTASLANGFMDQQQRQSVPPSSFSYADFQDSNTDIWATQVSHSTTINPTQLTVGTPSFGLGITSLTIGRWHRMKMQPSDLTCLYQPEQQALCWHIVDGEHHFKMEIPVANIKQLLYSSPCLSLDSSGVDQDTLGVMGELQLDLYQPPVFYVKQQEDWVACIDFTEHQQASQVLHHTLKGIGMTLWQELSTLMTTCPETQQWIKVISSPSSSSSSSMGDTSSYTGDALGDFVSINTDDYQQALLSTQASLMSKCDDPFTTVDDFIIDPSLLDPSLWSCPGYILS